MTRRLTIQSNILLAMLVVGIGSAALIGYQGYSHGKQALTSEVFKHLTSVRAARAYQIESYFQVIDSQARTWASDMMIVSAMREFRSAFKTLENEAESESGPKLEALYEEFITSLDQRTKGRPQIETYLPAGTASRYLQHHFLAASPYPSGERDKLDDAGDGSQYSEVHAKFHPPLRDLLREFAYYDLFLIDVDSGDIVYSVFKETDFATSLKSGPYRNSNLAKLVERVRANRDRGATSIADFEPYRPSLLAPASFIACPIFDEAECIGVLALQMPTDEINRVMTGDGHWTREGLGKSGETYLVGPDYLLRSESRFWLEDRDGYLKTMQQLGSAEDQVSLIENYGTTILQMSADTQASREAQKGQAGVQTVTDYRGVDVLSSYAPLEISGLDWVILAEMDLSEANVPVTDFTRTLGVSLVAVILAATVISLLFSVAFTRPIRTLAGLATRISEGENATFPEEKMNPEFRSLGKSLNRTLSYFRTESRNAEHRAERADRTLSQFLPDPIAARLKEDEWPILEEASNVSVLVARLTRTNEMVRNNGNSVAAGVALLDDLMLQFDVALQQHHVEKILGHTDLFVASSSLFETCIDPAKRLLDLASAMQQRLRRFNRAHRTDLGLRIGVHTGPAVVGLIGREACHYGIWGEGFDFARHLVDAASDGDVIASSFIHENVNHLFDFEPCGHETLEGQSIPVFRVITESSAVSEDNDIRQEA